MKDFLKLIINNQKETFLLLLGVFVIYASVNYSFESERINTQFTKEIKEDSLVSMQCTVKHIHFGAGKYHRRYRELELSCPTAVYGIANYDLPIYDISDSMMKDPVEVVYFKNTNCFMQLKGAINYDFQLYKDYLSLQKRLKMNPKTKFLMDKEQCYEAIVR